MQIRACKLHRKNLWSSVVEEWMNAQGKWYNVAHADFQNIVSIFTIILDNSQNVEDFHKQQIRKALDLVRSVSEVSEQDDKVARRIEMCVLAYDLFQANILWEKLPPTMRFRSIIYTPGDLKLQLRMLLNNSRSSHQEEI